MIEDYTAYVPSALAPQMFAAVPIIAEGQTIGVFVAQIDIVTLNNLLTDNNEWRSTGQGKTGEVLLTGEDRLLRCQSRFLIENPDRFIAQAKASGLPASTADQIRTLGTTILFMPNRSQGTEQAFHNKTGLARYLDYRGVEVISSLGPLEVAGLRWAIAAKQDVAEAFAPETRLKRDLLAAAALAAIALTFLALACAGLFMRPLRRVIAGMHAASSGNEAERIESRGNDEFAELARGYNAMADAIKQRDSRLVEAEREKGELLHSMYPSGVAERVRSGTEVTAETISNVTVVLTLIDGLDVLAADRSAPEVRTILNALLDSLNNAAASHGVEPLRSVGESYIGVCGLSSPYLDHATRTLAWARTATLALERMGEEWAKSVSLRFGLASGEIDVLLITRGHTAYDIWGHTLAVARRIVQEADPGCVRVSESTYALLTASVTVPLTFGVDIPPEQIRDAVIEAGSAVPNLVEPCGVRCFVTGIGDGKINYNVILSVGNPGILAGPRDEFLSRFWYLAQRRGLRLDPSPAPDAEARLRMLEQAGAFRRDSDIRAQLARESAFWRYRRGDLLLRVGIPATEAFLVIAGQLAVMVPTSDAEIRLELVASGQLLVLQEMLAGGSSPVRVVADQDTDLLAIPAQALVDAMEHSEVVARDIGAVAEARRQAILPLKLGLRVVA